MITLDNLANRYGFLPSEIMERGSTFDLQVMSVSSKYDAYMRKKAEEPDVQQELTQDDMKLMVKRVKDNAKG